MITWHAIHSSVRSLPLRGSWRGLLSGLFLLSLLVLGCTTDVYDKGEGQYSQMQADLVEAHTNADCSVTDVTTDANEQLRLDKPYSEKWLSRPDTTYRAVLYYNKVTENGSPKAQVITMNQVLTASIHPMSYFKKKFSDDPVKVESVWLSKSGKYLNLSLLLMVGNTDGGEQPRHTLGMASDSTATTPTALSLQLFHDQGGIPQYYTQRTIFSIVMPTTLPDTINLSINTYDGPIVRTIIPKQRKPSGNTQPSPQQP